MSFKLSSVAKFFSRVSHKLEDDKKTSTSQFVTVTPYKTEKADSKNSGSKISQFFQRLFHSKEKARGGVDAAFQKSNAQNPVLSHVQKPSSKTGVDFDIDNIALKVGTPKHFVMLKEITTVSDNPETELNRRHEFIESNEGRFMLDITNMGSCIDNSLQYFRTVPGIDLQKTLTAAFQIYYEEGKLVHEDSFATPGWGHEATAKSPEDLESLKANLEKINARRNDGQELLQKAVGAIEMRISRLNEDRAKGRNPS
jgi:hypothetical protein